MSTSHCLPSRWGLTGPHPNPLSDLQLVQASLADMALKIDASALLIYRAAWLKDRGAPRVTREAAMAKAYGTRLANDLVREAIQIHGALGFARQVGETGESVRLEEMYRDAKILEIFEGCQ